MRASGRRSDGGASLRRMGKIWTETECTDSVRSTARRFYEAYTFNSGNLNFQGNQCPAWSDLPTTVRSHWCAVAIASDPGMQGV